MTDRVLEMDEQSTIASLVTQVLTIPRLDNLVFPVDAIVTFCCMGETWQITKAIKEWEQNYCARYLLIAGASTLEETYTEWTVEKLVAPPYNLRRVDGVFHQVSARHTPDQMAWILETARELDVNRFIIFLPAYHATRAYLTLVKAMQKFPKYPLVALPSFTGVPLSQVVPEAGMPARLLVADEMRKILEYQRKGDVASLEELELYLDQVLYPELGY